VPAPGVNVANVRASVESVEGNSLFTLINLFSGGALLQLTVFRAGIMPYITASIICSCSGGDPRLETLQEGGAVRSDEDHPVHPLRHPGAGGAAGHGHRRAARSGQLFGTTTGRSLLYNEESIFSFVLIVITMTAGRRSSCGSASSSPTAGSATACRS
jgi:preprotein translocase subunit SecY